MTDIGTLSTTDSSYAMAVLRTVPHKCYFLPMQWVEPIALCRVDLLTDKQADPGQRELDIVTFAVVQKIMTSRIS